MAFLGWFDGELRPDAWFDAELQEAGWFDTELIDTSGGGAPGTQNLTAGLFTNSNTFNAHSIAPGTVTLNATTFQNANSFMPASVAPGAVTLAASLFENSNIFFGASADFKINITAAQARLIEQIARLHGLVDPLVVSATSRSDGTVVQTISEDAGAITVSTDSAGSTVFSTLWIDELAALYGIGSDVVVTDTSRTAGAIIQAISNDAGVTTVTRP